MCLLLMRITSGEIKNDIFIDKYKNSNELLV